MKYSTNVREQRFMRVEKLRGSNSIPGLHAFSISDDGIQMYPRILPPKVAPSYQPKIERVNTGIIGLDEMIETGFWRGSTTMVAGPSGSGKTILAMHFIREGVRLNESGVYLGFQENPTQLARVMLNLGWDVSTLLEGGLFEFMYRSPVEMQLDSVAAALFAKIREGKVKRVVIDALGDLERCSIDPQRFADFIYALMQWFAVENVTCMMTYETSELFQVHQISNQQLSNMTDNLILLGLSDEEQMKRTIRIVKTRGSAHDNRKYPLEIGNLGAVVKRK
jgi:circadian clock protein KaiC